MPELVTVDAETFYSRDFSLTKLTTEAYVRDSRFEVIGVAIKIGDGRTTWYPKPEVAGAIESIDWSDKLVLAQNCAFDAAILAWRYGVKPLAWLDTLGMSRALFPHEKSHSLDAQAKRMGVGTKGTEVHNALGMRYEDFTPATLAPYGAYCKNDVELTYGLFQRYMAMGFPKQELKLIDMTLRMFVEPVLKLDADLLTKHLVEVRSRKRELLERVRDNMLANADPDYIATVFSEGTEGIKKLLMSNEKFAAALQSLGVDPPRKVSATTGKETWAFAKTDEAFKALEEHPSEEVQALVAARLGNKTTLEETRTERFIDMARRGAFPVPLRYYGAHSGRWSGQDAVNMQNLPSRGPNAGAIKKAILPPDGHVMIDCDSAQIEARTLAWLAGQDDLVQAFRDKQDVYKLMASKIYGVPVEEVTPLQRQVGKTVVLGAGYGVGHVKLQGFLKVQAKVEVSLSEAKRIIDTYRAAAPRITELWARSGDALRALMMGQEMPIDVPGLVRVVPGQGLTLPSGLCIQYPELRAVTGKDGKRELVYTSKGLPVRIYGGKCLGADTEVLTPRGWVPIVSVATDDKVWDGVEWVNHSGLTFQGYKPTIVLNGVRMTEDHEVLTNYGWRDASSCEGLYGADFWMPDGSEVRGGRTAFHLGVPVPMRGARNPDGDRRGEICEAWWKFVLRLRSRGKKCYARDVEPPSVLGLEVNARPLQATFASGVAQLWSAWDNGMRRVGEVVRAVLAGHGLYISAWAHAGSERQQPGIQPRKLPLGVYGRASREPKELAPSGHPQGARVDGGAEVYTGIPMETRPVYDLLNAGPRSRFVVRGSSGPFVVHNCVENFTQAIARCIVAEQMLRISKRYPVVLTVHDAAAIVAPEAKADEARAYVEECMSWNPAWAQGLPLACESGVGASYGDC
jgi:DNA polymerase